MVVYSIKDLEELSGVKAHTIRIWEKRYDIIKPKRTPNNTRYYLDDDLKHILNISILNKSGIKISKIAEMDIDEIKHRVAELTEVSADQEDQLDSLTLSLLEMNEEKISLILDKNIEQRGFAHTMMEVIYPLLDKLAVMWMSGSVKSVHEKFISNLIQRKCACRIDAMPCSHDETFLIYLPEGERNELSLLFLHYLIARHGFKVVNIGTDISVDEILDACDICSPDFVFTIINESMDTDTTTRYVSQICKTHELTRFLLSGVHAHRVSDQLPQLVESIASSEDAISYLSELATACGT